MAEDVAVTVKKGVPEYTDTELGKRVTVGVPASSVKGAMDLSAGAPALPNVLFHIGQRFCHASGKNEIFGCQRGKVEGEHTSLT